MELEEDRRASCAANIGDIVSDDDKIVRIIAINGNTIELDKRYLVRRERIIPSE